MDTERRDLWTKGARIAGDWKAAFQFLHRFRHLRRKAFWANVCGALSGLLQLALPLSSAVLINRILPDRDFGLLLWLTAGVATATILSSALTYGEFYFSAVFRERAYLELQRDLFEHIQKLPVPYFKHHDSGTIMSEVANDTSVASDLLTGLTSLGRNSTWLFSAVFLLPAFDPIIGIVLCLVIPLYAATLAVFNQRIKHQFSVVQERTAKSSRELYESLSGIYETKAYSAELRQARRYVNSLVSKTRSLIHGRQLMTFGGHTTQLIVLLVSVFILTYGGAKVMRGQLSLGALVALNTLAGYLLLPISGLVNQGFQVQRSLAAIERLSRTFSLPTEPHGQGITLRRPARGHLRFDRVTFQHEGGSPILCDVKIDIQPGETVLFLGPSGAGKTTLVGMLPRFFEPIAGEILLDGRPLWDFDIRSLRRQFAFVSQDTFLFSDSVFNNIRIGKPDADREEILEAARQANAWDFIMGLPDGFDTQVGERGCRLSGGQRQRIAIARALLKGAPILILDEATSAVDKETESAVYEALNRLMKGRTTLVVAHHADAFLHRIERIFLVKDRSVVEMLSDRAEERLAS